MARGPRRHRRAGANLPRPPLLHATRFATTRGLTAAGLACETFIDAHFDTPDGALMRAGCWLRSRLDAARHESWCLVRGYDDAALAVGTADVMAWLRAHVPGHYTDRMPTRLPLQRFTLADATGYPALRAQLDFWCLDGARVFGRITFLPGTDAVAHDDAVWPALAALGLAQEPEIYADRARVRVAERQGRARHL